MSKRSNQAVETGEDNKNRIKLIKFDVKNQQDVEIDVALPALPGQLLAHIQKAVKKAMTPGSTKPIVLHVEFEERCDDVAMAFTPSDAGIGVRLVSLLYQLLTSDTKKTNYAGMVAHVDLTSACLEPHTQTSKAVFKRLLGTEQPGCFKRLHEYYAGDDQEGDIGRSDLSPHLFTVPCSVFC